LSRSLTGELRRKVDVLYLDGRDYEVRALAGARYDALEPQLAVQDQVSRFCFLFYFVLVCLKHVGKYRE
jgi:hypothetical protein